jgi:CubicO group peptidase (beta-lactamase class C family)
MVNRDIFGHVIGRLTTSLDKKGNHLDLSSIIVSDGQDSLSHDFRPREKVDIRSIAKPIVCMAIGAAIDRGLEFAGVRVELDTPIWQFLSRYTTLTNAANQDKWPEVNLMDCFRITMGHEKGLMFSSDVKEHDPDDLIDYVVNYPITGIVGKDFVYSNAGTFIVSTLVTEFLGRQLDDLVAQFIFHPLGISDYSWKSFGKYCAGCTGLLMYNEDLHKVGQLLINDGEYNGQQLVPRRWIEQMRTPQVATPTHRYIADRAFPKWSYGMNLWICEDGNYYCDGSEGQYLIVIPAKGLVITMTGHQVDTEPISASLGRWK